MGCNVTVIDNLSSGTLENLQQSISKIRFLSLDLEYCKLSELKEAFADNEVVFHLAATHGGRGYIDTHPADVASNFSIDHHVFEACTSTSVDQVVFTSSACVYPPKLQSKVGSDYLLKESDADISDLSKPLSSDLEYGWAKLMGEVQLRSFVRQYGVKGCSVRFVTAYGPRENETHAIIALIYKAFEQMNPFVIWGDGNQERDFTYVSDLVTGSILAAEKVRDGSAVNLGTGRRFSLIDIAKMIFELMDFHPQVKFDISKPVGVLSRALDISNSKQVLGWEPAVSLKAGLKTTVDWYVANHKRNGGIEERILLERTPL